MAAIGRIKSPRWFLRFNPPHLPRNKTAFGRNRAEQIHHGRGIRASHAEIDQRDALGGGVRHRPIDALDQSAVRRGEPFDVIVEIGQENMVANSESCVPV